MNNAPSTPDVGERPALSTSLMAVCFYLMSAPVWFPPFPFRIYDAARIFELILLTALVPLALLPDARRGVMDSWRRLHPWVRVFAVALLMSGTVSTAFSGVPQFGAQQIALVTLLIWLTLIVCAAVRCLGKPAELSLAVAVSLGTGLACVKFWVTYFQNLDAGRSFSWVSPFLDFANVRFFGQYQAYALLLVTLPTALLPLTRSWRLIIWIAAANFWALQWMVGSRAVWAGLLAALGVVAICMRRGRFRWLGEQGCLVVAGGAIYLVFSVFVLSTPSVMSIPTANSILARGTQSISERVTLARNAGHLIAEHPLLGVGPGQFGLHYAKTAAAHPHNTPLQLLAEYGVVGGAAGIGLGVLLVLYAVRELRKRTMHRPDLVTAGLVAALVMGLVDSLFSGNLIMPHSQVLLCVLAGWLVGRTTAPYPAHVSYGRRPIEIVLPGAAILAALTGGILAVEYVDVIRSMAYPANLRIPSFWQYGRFTAW